LDDAVNDGYARSTRAASPDSLPGKIVAPSILPQCHLLYGHPLMVKLIDPPTGA